MQSLPLPAPFPHWFRRSVPPAVLAQITADIEEITVASEVAALAEFKRARAHVLFTDHTIMKVLYGGDRSLPRVDFIISGGAHSESVILVESKANTPSAKLREKFRTTNIHLQRYFANKASSPWPCKLVVLATNGIYRYNSDHFDDDGRLLAKDNGSIFKDDVSGLPIEVCSVVRAEALERSSPRRLQS